MMLNKNKILLGCKLVQIKDGDHAYNKVMNTRSMRAVTKTMDQAHKVMIPLCCLCFRACRSNRMSGMRRKWFGIKNFRKLKTNDIETCRNTWLPNMPNLRSLDPMLLHKFWLTRMTYMMLAYRPESTV